MVLNYDITMCFTVSLPKAAEGDCSSARAAKQKGLAPAPRRLRIAFLLLLLLLLLLLFLLLVLFLLLLLLMDLTVFLCIRNCNQQA